MAYEKPPMKFDRANENFKVDLPIKEPKYLKSDVDLNNEIKKEAFIFLIILIILVIFGYYMIKYFS